MSGPLAGRRILVTRARRQAGRLAAALEAAGAEVLPLAAIETVPPESYDALDAALRQIASFDWLVLTSANGAEALSERLRVVGVPRPLPLRTIAIGPATAEAARRLGLAVDRVPDRAVAESVADALGDAGGQRILVVRAAVARDVIPGRLRQGGAEVVVAEAYRTVIPDGSVEQTRRIFEPESTALPDAATFTSASTVTNFLALVATAGVARPASLRAVSIGPITSAALRANGWEPAVEAAEASVPGLVEACIRLPGPLIPVR